MTKVKRANGVLTELSWGEQVVVRNDSDKRR